MQTASKHLQGWRCNNLSGISSSQCSISLTANRCLPMFRWNLLCFSLHPLPLVTSLGSTEESLAPSSLCLPSGYLYTNSLHWAKQTWLSQLLLIWEMLQTLEHLSRTLQVFTEEVFVGLSKNNLLQIQWNLYPLLMTLDFFQNYFHCFPGTAGADRTKNTLGDYFEMISLLCSLLWQLL